MISARPLALRLVISLPSIEILPRRGSSVPLIKFKSVDLPAPFCPKIVSIAPASRLKFTSRSVRGADFT